MPTSPTSPGAPRSSTPAAGSEGSRRAEEAIEATATAGGDGAMVEHVDELAATSGTERSVMPMLTKDVVDANLKKVGGCRCRMSGWRDV